MLKTDIPMSRDSLCADIHSHTQTKERCADSLSLARTVAAES